MITDLAIQGKERIRTMGVAFAQALTPKAEAVDNHRRHRAPRHHNRTAEGDPEPTFMASPADGWAA